MLQIEKIAHITHAVRDRAAAKALYQRILGASVFYEGPLPAQQRAASLLLIEDLCVELIDLPYDPDDAYVAKHGGRFHSLALRLRGDVETAAQWLASHGVRFERRHERHLVTDPASTHGVRLELTNAGLPEDPRAKPGWRAPHGASGLLCFDGLWSITMLVDDVPAADGFFKAALGARQVGERLEGEFTTRSNFYALGSSRVSIMVPKAEGSELIRVVETQGLGIHGVCLNTPDVSKAQRFFGSLGLGLLGRPETRITIHPRGFMGARYLFMRRPDPSDPMYVWREPLPARET